MKTVKKIVFVDHNGSGNHGCEALVRGLCLVLSKMGIKDALLLSASPEEDLKYGLDHIVCIDSSKKRVHRFSLSFLFAYLYHLVFKEYIYLDLLPYRKQVEATLNIHTVAFSIAGDGYCYGNTKDHSMLHGLYRRQGSKTVLWTCSISPESLNDKELIADLRSYDLITARESLTYNALVSKGLKNVLLFPDGAFNLGRVDLPLPSGFIEGNTVGVNVSPMIISNETNAGITFRNYLHLLDYILRETTMNIALIPHVVWSSNDDRVPLQKLKEELFQLINNLEAHKRVCLIEDHNAEELKGFIARCRFMVAARTHASIAAYSSCVPTLVIGYSVKARGIARDLFGTDENYVISVQSLSSEKELLHSFQWLQKNEIGIRSHLNLVMPDYKKKLDLAEVAIRKIL